MSIEPQVQAFRVAVQKLALNAEPTPGDLLTVLLIRQDLAGAVKIGGLRAADVEVLAVADGQLAELSGSERVLRLSDDLDRWRRSLCPDAGEWWWDLDRAQPSVRSISDYVWTAVAGICLTLSVGLLTEVASRFLKDGPDLYGALNIAAQTLLAIVSASALTENGRIRISRLFDAFRLPTIKQTALTVGISAAALLLAFLLYLSLPLWARLYNNSGDGHRTAGSLLEAGDALKRAITLQPDYAEAHYNLAVVYEDLFQIDKSIVEYKAAVALRPDFPRAENNLARAILVEGKYPGIALGILDKLISRFNGRAFADDEKYAAYKNRAWAKIALNYGVAAEADARKALGIHKNGASAYCLLAKATEPAATTDEAKALNRSNWENCIARANEDPSVEPVWLLEARSKVQAK